MIAGFSLAGTERTPAVHAPSATKLMWPNETTPELPTKMYSATTIETMTSALMKYVWLELDTTAPNSAASTTSRTGAASCAVAAARLIPAPPRRAA